ncbi:MAG: ATP synthase F1 subunit delta [Lachnospiraceae bacterium]|nr:ATP synthase F1 subunit delta [Lachnospiraceae bacterium]
MTKAGDIYGKSLYDLAGQENLSDEILAEMEAVRDIFRENPDYIRLLSEPSIPKRERLSLLDESFGDSIHEYLLNFMKILAERGILREFGACFKAFRKRYNDDHGIGEAFVTSPNGLSDAERSKLKDKLEKITGKKIVLIEKQDPAVLGGIKVLIDDKLYDGTVRGRLSELKRRVDETVL